MQAMTECQIGYTSLFATARNRSKRWNFLLTLLMAPLSAMRLISFKSNSIYYLSKSSILVYGAAWLKRRTCCDKVIE